MTSSRCRWTLPQYKDSLLKSFSGFLLEDVRQLKQAPLGLLGACWFALFCVGYGFVEMKSLLGWRNRTDLLFLVGLELSFIRSLPGLFSEPQRNQEKFPMEPKTRFTFGVGTLSLVVAFFSVVTLFSHTSYRDEIQELKKSMSIYQVVLDAVLASPKASTSVLIPRA